MKIINCFLGKSRGGIEVVGLDYADALAECGYESEILTLKKRNYTDYLIKGGHKMHYLISRGLNPITILHFIMIMKSQKPDIVFLHGTKAIEFGTHFLTKLLCPKIRFVGVSHGVIGKKYKKLKYLITITQKLKNDAEHLVTNRFILYNTTQEQQQTEASHQKDSIIIGTSGRDSPAKGFDILLKALALLKQEHIDFKCLFAGSTDKNYKTLIKDLELENNVVFLGWITNKNEFYKNLDIYCSASRFESFGLTIIEAMMHKIPVIATDCDGPSEILTNNAGIIVPKENHEKLAEALKKMINTPDERIQIGQKGYEHVVENFNRKKLPEKLNTIIQSILKIKH